MIISEGNQTQSDALSHFFPSNLLLVSSYAINLILGLPTNVYVLWLIISEAGGTMASEFFALNLAMTEILFCLLNIFAIVYQYLNTEPFRMVSYFSLGLFTSGRPLFQTCICLERYLAVVHPVVFLRYKPLRYRRACCVLVWMLVLGICSVSIFLKLVDLYFYVYNVLIMATFGVMLFCCLSVLRALKRPGPGEGEREGERGGEGGKATKTRAFKIILIILLCTVIPLLPFAVTAYLKKTMTYADFYCASVVLLLVLIMTGFVNPLLYLHRAGKLPFLNGLL